MESVNHDQSTRVRSSCAIKYYPSSHENATRGPKQNVIARSAPFTVASGVPMQLHQSTGQSVSPTGSITTTACTSDSRMAPTQYNTGQYAAAVASDNPAVSGRVETPRDPYWVLVEWEKPSGERNSYAVISSTHIIDRTLDPGQSRVEEGAKDFEYYTGKLIHVQHGEHVLPATIVIVSDDKKFIETELGQLRKLAANNVDSNSVSSLSQPHNRQQHFVPANQQPEEQFYGYKHQPTNRQTQQQPERKQRVAFQHHHHVDQQDVIRATKRLRTDSGSSFTMMEASSMSSSSLEGASSEKSIIKSVAYDAGHRATLPERTITARNGRTPCSDVVVPMTFDQQTQTMEPALQDHVYEAPFRKILSYLEGVMAEQKTCRMEREYDRKLLHDLHERLRRQDAMLKRIEQVVTAQRHEKRNNPSGVAGAGDRLDQLIVLESPHLADRCLVSNEIGSYLSKSPVDSERFVEQSTSTLSRISLPEHDANSNQSWVSSVNVPVKNHNGMGSSMGSTDAVETPLVADYVIIDTAENSTAALPEQCTSVSDAENSTSSTTMVSLERAAASGAERLNTIAELKNDWSDSVGDDGPEEAKSREEELLLKPEQHMTSIGEHGTLVKQDMLEFINWSNYKSATRKLLVEVFGRETLATHSLSGRPSPASRAYLDKPIKDRLEPNAVADVIEIVCKRCNVHEGMIRNVITAKCADENKMRKQRQGLLPKKTNPPRTGHSGGATNAHPLAENKENIG